MSILFSCRQAYRESIDLWYGGPFLVFDCGEHTQDWVGAIGTQNTNTVRYIALDFKRGTYEDHCHEPQLTSVAQACQGLRVLELRLCDSRGEAGWTTWEHAARHAMFGGAWQNMTMVQV